MRADRERNRVASPGLGCSMLNKDLFQLRPDVISKPLLIVSDVERDPHCWNTVLVDLLGIEIQ